MNSDNPQKPEKLTLADQWLYEGLVKEALDLLNDFEKNGELTVDNRILFYNLKSRALDALHRFEEALTLAERAIREYRESESKLLLCDALIVKAWCLRMVLRYEEATETISSLENLLDQITDELPSEIATRTVLLYTGKAFESARKNKISRGIQYLEKSREISKRYDDKRGLMLTTGNIGIFSIHL